MYQIIQSENDFEAVIDSKDTLGEAEDYVSALNEMYKHKSLKFYYKECNSPAGYESSLFVDEYNSMYPT